MNNLAGLASSDCAMASKRSRSWILPPAHLPLYTPSLPPSLQIGTAVGPSRPSQQCVASCLGSITGYKIAPNTKRCCKGRERYPPSSGTQWSPGTTALASLVTGTAALLAGERTTPSQAANQSPPTIGKQLEAKVVTQSAFFLPFLPPSPRPSIPSPTQTSF